MFSIFKQSRNLIKYLLNENEHSEHKWTQAYCGFICCSKGMEAIKYSFIGHWIDTGRYSHMTSYGVSVEKTEGRSLFANMEQSQRYGVKKRTMLCMVC